MSYDIQPEFAEYVMLLENHIDNFIGWSDGNWDQQRKRKTYMKKKLNRDFVKDKSLGDIAN
jgi:hypothetical protein